MITFQAVCWLVVYCLVIRRGFMEKTYGIPLAAICTNLTWEFLFTFFLRPPNPDFWVWFFVAINFIWFVVDLVIFYQLLRYGPNEGWPSRSVFYGSIVIACSCALSGILIWTLQNGDWEGRFTSFVANLLMSILFVHMVYYRGIRGQSMYIALFKLIGSLSVSIAFLMESPSNLVQWYLSMSVLFFDVLYSVVLYRRISIAGLNPWTRL
jgi:hypothetical protein